MKFLICFLFPFSVALAQDAATVATPTNWMPIVLGGITGLVVLVGLFNGWQWLRKKIDVLFDHLAAKTKLAFLANVDEILIGFAVDLYQSEIKYLKEHGKWDDAAKAGMLRTLKEKAKQHFGLGALGAIAGSGSSEDINSFVASRAQSAIGTAKARAKLQNPTKA